MEAADLTLISGDVRGVARAIELSNATVRNIKQNLFWAFAYNVALIPVAAGVLYPLFSDGSVPEVLRPVLGEYGFLNPVLAAAAMALSSVTVVSQRPAAAPGEGIEKGASGGRDTEKPGDDPRGGIRPRLHKGQGQRAAPE